MLGSVHNSLSQLFFLVACATCNARLRKIHYMEHVFTVLTSVLDPEIEPLLMALGICVDLHVETVVVLV